MARMGRPKVEDPRIKAIGIRVTKDEYKAISEFASKRKMTITEAVLKGLRILMKEPEK